MSLSGKINALFISLALLLCFVLTGLSAYREYQSELNQLTSWSAVQSLNRPDLQIHFYRRSDAQLKPVLEKFLEAPEVLFAVAHSGQGDLLARADRTGGARALPPFSAIRDISSAAETGLLALTQDGKPTGTDLWAAVANPGSLIHLTIPVFSAVDPTKSGFSDQDIAMAMIAPDNNSSLVVTGYIHIGIDTALLQASIKPFVFRVLFGNLAVVLLLSAAVIVITRRFSLSLSRLTQLAEEVTSGKRETHVDVGGTPEVANIANMLNSLVGNSNDLKTEAHLSNKILSLKMDERSSQLSQRDEELITATQEISKTKRQLHRLAYYDSLTSLPNRRLFTEQLSLLLRLNERNKSNLALLLINLDNFKRINDSLGQNVGDLVLQEVAIRLSDSLRDSDAVAYQKDSGPNINVSRWGGDEFTVVLNQVDSVDDVGPVAQRLINKLLEPITIEDSELVVTASIGIAIAPGDAGQVQALFSAASAAMYYARDSRQDDFIFFKPEMDAAGADRIKLESDLRKAVERNELVLHYQPQIDTVSGSVVGAEALLRWEHPEFGLVAPDKFIALAEEIGLISELGDWVLLETCRTVKSFEKRALKLPRVAINISATQFSSTFCKRVFEVLQQVDLRPSMLELSLAESILMGNDNSTLEALQGLKETGVYLSVDDFGTSHSPMGYLSRSPLDELKIDRSFVKDIDGDDSDSLLVKAIISMADKLKLSTVAEGVETEEQYRFLRSNGVKVMQGYLFSKPVTAIELESLLAPWHFAEQVQAITL